MNVYFLFPWCRSPLLFDSLSVLVVRGGAVCLPTPPSCFSPVQSFDKPSGSVHTPNSKCQMHTQATTIPLLVVDIDMLAHLHSHICIVSCLRMHGNSESLHNKLLGVAAVQRSLQIRIAERFAFYRTPSVLSECDAMGRDYVQ